MTGTFALTFDTELIWGSFDTLDPEAFERRYPDVRGVIERVLRLLDQYEIPATWAVVGHLFLRSCDRGPDGRAHPDLIRPGQRWWPGDWYAVDPCTDRDRDPLWYGDDVLDAILAAATDHEIGCHSFGHALFGDPDLTREAVDADLRACRDLAARRGLELTSFVFPRNLEGHHDLLRDHGFVAFRGADPTWHARLPAALSRGGHLVDQALGLAPPVRRPRERLPGLWNVPGSALLLHRTGIRRAVPLAARRRKAERGLRRAAAEGGVFHLWTHPFNLAPDRDLMLRTLEAILAAAASARDRGEVRIETLTAIARRAATEGDASSPPGLVGRLNPSDAP